MGTWWAEMCVAIAGGGIMRPTLVDAVCMINRKRLMGTGVLSKQSIWTLHLI